MKALLKKKKFWFNIHLLLTFIFCIPLILVAVSGSILSYRSEIITALNTKNIEIKGETIAIPKILDQFFKQNNEKFNYIRSDGNPNHAYILATYENAYFINQYTGEVLGKSYGTKINRFFMTLHRNLTMSLSGNETAAFIGKHIVALSTITMLLLIISGVVIYFPYFKKSFIKVFKINFKAKGYNFLYQFHSSLGMWFGVFVFFIALTGLYWSYEFIENGVNKALNIEAHHHGHGDMQISRELSKAETTLYSAAMINKFGKDFGKIGYFTLFPSEENVIMNFKFRDDNETKRVTFSSKTRDFVKPQAIGMHNAQADSNSTKPKRSHHFMRELHMGTYFGEIGRFLFCVSSLMIVFFLVTGFMMTYKRINR